MFTLVHVVVYGRVIHDGNWLYITQRLTVCYSAGAPVLTPARWSTFCSVPAFANMCRCRDGRTNITFRRRRRRRRRHPRSGSYTYGTHALPTRPSNSRVKIIVMNGGKVLHRPRRISRICSRRMLQQQVWRTPADYSIRLVPCSCHIRPS